MKNGWEFPISIGFLIICLVAGMAIADYSAPMPTIGVVRFADVIYQDSANHLLEVIEAAKHDDSVAAVVLEIDSPGGLATSSENLFYSLLELRDEKPLVVTIDSIAASGGYYMAIAANEIFAAPSSYVGNVGVRGPRPYDPYIDPLELSSGPYKLAGASRFDQIQQFDLLKQAFVGHVVNQRSNATVNPLTVTADTVAEARLYLGSEALGIGYIDSEGGRSDAIDAAIELANVADYQVVDLLGYYGFDFSLEYQQPTFTTEEQVAQVFATAPSSAIYLLDSRIPLPNVTPKAAVEAHLLSLRASAAGALRTPYTRLISPQGGPPALTQPQTPVQSEGGN
ncbi:MAG: S49 family peptidase [Caldilineaceae bacterium]|nr:S49 family peptidase [Caldilineaceae bacterium]